MSSKKSATRRLSLLTGSSLVAASLAAAASLGGALVPTAALAQSVCTPAPTSGAGTNNVTYSSGNQTSGIVCAATGNFILNKTTGTASRTTAYALGITSTGTTTVNVTGGNIGSASVNMPSGTGAVDFSGVAGGVTFNLEGATNTTGRWLGSGASVFGAGNDTVNFLGVGHNFLGGRGAVAAASIDFGAGNDTINLASFLNMGGHTQDAGTIDFGAGNDTFNISGVFTSHGGTLANLEALNLSGTILMGHGTTGSNNNNFQVNWTVTDNAADDVLRVHGATFTGSGDARIVMDAFLGAETQAGCETPTGGADCLDLRGGSTAGVTVVTVNNLSTGGDFGDNQVAAGLFNPNGVTIVDVGGGSSAAGHFILDPDTEGLINDRSLGDVIERPGLFAFALRYDEANQRHVLVGLPRSETMEYAMLTGAAQSIWYMTAETVTDRQTDLRGGGEGAFWVRATGEATKRDIATPLQVFGDTLTIDNSYKLYAGTIMGGVDLISGHSGGYEYVVGGQIGYVSSSFELDQSPTSGRMTGATGGIYGSIWNNRLFLDGTFNVNGLALDHESPGLGSKTTTYTTGFGALLEGGMRAMLTERTFIEPLVTVAFVRTGFEEISLDGGEVLPGDANSQRAALGARLGADLTEGPLNVSYFVAGRAWNEFDGEAKGDVHNPGVDLPFHDEFSGAFSEAELGVNVFNEANTLSGFLSSGVKWKDGYSAVNLSLGVRVAW